MYLNQDAVLKQRLPDLSNPYGEFVYSAPKTIKVRKQPKTEEVADKEGKIHKTNFEIYTKDLIAVDDTIDDRLVLFVEGYITLAGKIVLYRGLTV